MRYIYNISNKNYCIALNKAITSFCANIRAHNNFDIPYELNGLDWIYFKRPRKNTCKKMLLLLYTSLLVLLEKG